MTPSANHPIEQLPGLNEAQLSSLQRCGIATTFDLLRRASSINQRQQLSSELNIHIKYINKWTALANLSRIPAVGCEHCGLLLHAGVSSPQQLAGMSVQQLHPLLTRLQVQLLNRADLAPNTGQVATWIQQAKAMR